MYSYFGDKTNLAVSIGAIHLATLTVDPNSGAGWQSTCKDVLGYHQDGTVYFRRSDTGAFDILSASEISTGMMAGLPAEEQQRIRAHAEWYGLYAASFRDDDMGRLTPDAKRARATIRRISNAFQAGEPAHG